MERSDIRVGRPGFASLNPGYIPEQSRFTSLRFEFGADRH
jgi:hypothetical protein